MSPTRSSSGRGFVRSAGRFLQQNGAKQRVASHRCRHITEDIDPQQVGHVSIINFVSRAYLTLCLPAPAMTFDPTSASHPKYPIESMGVEVAIVDCNRVDHGAFPYPSNDW
jgi:hypothetical protein